MLLPAALLALAGSSISAEPRNCWSVPVWSVQVEDAVYRLTIGAYEGGAAPLEIIRHEGGRALWSMSAALICSNGISICKVFLPLATPAPEELAIEAGVGLVRGPDGRDLCVLSM